MRPAASARETTSATLVATPDAFHAKLGLRGVQFGNYVEQAPARGGPGGGPRCVRDPRDGHRVAPGAHLARGRSRDRLRREGPGRHRPCLGALRTAQPRHQPHQARRPGLGRPRMVARARSRAREPRRDQPLRLRLRRTCLDGRLPGERDRRDGRVGLDPDRGRGDPARARPAPRPPAQDPLLGDRPRDLRPGVRALGAHRDEAPRPWDRRTSSR